MGSIVKGVTAAFTQGKKNKAAKAAQGKFDQDLNSVRNFQFSNPLAGAQSQGFDAAQIGQIQKADVAQLGPAAQATAEGYESQGYDAQGYESQGYEAERAAAAQAAKTQLGEDTGFTNQFQDLQVNTAAADRQAEESDAALAAAQEQAALTGGGGATALAQAALKAKQGVADTIAGQEAQNQQLRAQGATDIQRANLAQRNTARQANIQQDQFNTGLDQQTRLANQAAANQAAQFGASAANQAAQFTAGAQNQAAQFGAAAANQAAQFGASARNRASEVNAGANNNFALQQFGAQNQANNAFAGASNNAALQQAQLNQQANQFGASAANNLQLQQAQLGAQTQQAQFGALNTALGISNQQNQQAQAAKQQGISDIAGGVGGIASAFLSDERTKENIKLVGKSPSGINIYQYNYIDSDIIYEGVIAQEVPQASIEGPDGFLRVDYDKIDVELKIVE